MKPRPYDWRENGFGSFRVGVRAIRECGIREGRFEPVNATERRWRREGPRPPQELEAGGPDDKQHL